MGRSQLNAIPDHSVLDIRKKRGIIKLLISCGSIRLFCLICEHGAQQVFRYSQNLNELTATYLI